MVPKGSGTIRDVALEEGATVAPGFDVSFAQVSEFPQCRSLTSSFLTCIPLISAGCLVLVTTSSTELSMEKACTLVLFLFQWKCFMLLCLW